MADERINVAIILEVLGRPVDYAKQVFEKLINEQLAGEKGVEIVNKKISEPKQIEGQDLFTLFAEIELNLDSMLELLLVLFKYTPSHVEVITPENLRVKNDDLSILSNEMVKKLHQYDEIAKALTIERNMLMEQLKKAGIEPVSALQNFAQQAKQNKEVEKKSEKKRSRKKKKTLTPS